MAAVLYQKTEKGITVIDINTLGVLYVVENGTSIQSFADLKGKTIYMTGKGTTPEYALNYLLEKNGLTREDVTSKKIFTASGCSSKNSFLTTVTPVTKLLFSSPCTLSHSSVKSSAILNAASLADSQLFYSQDFICQPYRGGKEFVSSRRRGRFLESDFLFFYESGNRIFFVWKI